MSSEILHSRKITSAEDITTVKVASTEESSDANLIADGNISFDPRVEHRLVQKLDIRLLPLLSLMYLFNSVSTKYLCWNFN